MTVWIDLTDFLKWTGNLTGIQRIQYNLSKKFIADKSVDAKFFVYMEDTRTFREVAFDPDSVVKSGIVGIEHAAHFNERVRAKLKKLFTMQPDANRANSLFAEQDTVLIMGGIWVGDFIDDLASLKQRHRFAFVHFAFDMIPSLLPGYVVDWLPAEFTRYQKKVFSMAEGILAISQSTAADVRIFIQEHQIANNPAIDVVRIGEEISTGEKESRVTPVAALKDKKFILSVSTIEGRKNHTALFYAYKQALQQGIKLPIIVIVGRSGWLTNDFQYIVRHDPESQKGMMLLENIDDSQLGWLYRNCQFTIFPSFYEGWGMPIAESLAYGKACLASRTSSMPEIGGSLVDYFSPYDTGEILECMQAYMDTKTLKSKEAAIRKDYAPTSWDDMYSTVKLFLEQIRAT